eukprot:1139682-Prymnesium_polylepis.2
MSRKLYLAHKAGAAEANFDPDEAVSAAEDDWSSDSGGMRVMSGADFKRSWFELADVYVESMSADHYVRAPPPPRTDHRRGPARSLVLKREARRRPR